MARSSFVLRCSLKWIGLAESRKSCASFAYLIPDFADHDFGLIIFVPQLFGVLFVTFFLIRLLPGDQAPAPASAIWDSGKQSQLYEKRSGRTKYHKISCSLCPESFTGPRNIDPYLQSGTVALWARAPARLS